MSTVVPAAKDSTFRFYSSEQAKVYATHRQSYQPALYEIIFKHHADTGGAFDLLLDCGCGPGNATRDLALSFDQAVGCDAGVAMIESAKGLRGKTKSGKDIIYEVSPAEEFSNLKVIKPGSVDLLTVAMAAHWFEMDEFWVEASKVVKPGGTVAIWIRASWFCHPSTANADKVMATLLRFEREVLAPYETPGNRLSRDMYDNLTLPWDVSPPVTDFPKSQYVKRDYDREGKLSNGETFFGGGTEVSLHEIERGLSTGSMVTRWREAHPALVGTDKDCLKEFVRDLREALGGPEKFLAGSGTAILLFKKKTD